MYRYSVLIIGLVQFFSLTTLAIARADELTGDEIVRRADMVMIGNFAEYSSVMVIKRPNLKDYIAKYRTYFRERGRKVLVRVLHPPEEIGKDLLLIGDNMWQYVPNVERSVRIAGTQRFLGGDFNNSDLLEVSLIGDYHAKLVNIVEIDGMRCYYLDLRAKRPGTAYDRVNYWVRMERFIPFKEEYVTLSGKKMKSLNYSDVGKLGNRIRPRKLTMINSLRPTHRTIVNIVKAEYDKKIPNLMFTRTYLERKR
ncbi:MAG: outer membrane lipoprotein-sorting protein [Promethearchaeota archaeon]|jgi:outer membrane lipoprotein-sorting protein